MFYEAYYRPLVNAWHDKPEGYDWRAETQAYRAKCRHYWPRVPNSQWFDVGGGDCNPEYDDGLIEQLDVERTYALVTCCQTLDHLLDPAAAFHKFAQLVPRGGFLWVDIVNFEETKEIKADHPLNWTPRTMAVCIRHRPWRVMKCVQVDATHIGYLLERL